jgi:hypothetical protein
MSTWRRKAIEYLPELKHEIESREDYTSLWMNLLFPFQEALKSNDFDLVNRFIDFARWSIASDNDKISQAVGLCFLEHLPTIPNVAAFFPKWFTQDEFHDLRVFFTYLATQEQVSAIESSYVALTKLRKHRSPKTPWFHPVRTQS